MNAYRSTEAAKLHAILILANANERSTSCLGHIILEKMPLRVHWIEGWMTFRATMDVNHHHLIGFIASVGTVRSPNLLEILTC
jgi:hypothetical protein